MASRFVFGMELDDRGEPVRFTWHGRRQVRRVVRRWTQSGVVRFGDLGRTSFLVEVEDGAWVELSRNDTSGTWTARLERPERTHA